MRKYNNQSNISGKIIEQYREELKMSRDELASQLQLLGINIDYLAQQTLNLVNNDNLFLHL